jgi:hypothetical protein
MSLTVIFPKKSPGHGSNRTGAKGSFRYVLFNNKFIDSPQQ